MKKKSVAGILIILAILTVAILVFISNKTQIEGWNEFKKGAISNYSYIKRIHVDSVTPPNIKIVYRLDRKIEMEEVDDIFIYTKNYILTENVFNDLQEIHKKNFKYSFSEIQIYLFYKNIFECKIHLYEDKDTLNGEPNYYNFNIWDIEYDHEPIKSYNP